MTKILVVDDEEQIRRLLNRTLSGSEYTCILAADGAEARKCLDEQSFDLVLCDVKMPGESGIDLTRHIAAAYEDTAVIMLTAVDDPKTADAAIEAGAYGYIIKPFTPNALIINLRNALRRRQLEIANRMYRQDLEKMVAERTSQLKKALDGIIQTIASIIEIRDPYTAGHQTGVARLALAIAQGMGLSHDQAEGVRVAGTIHDLGKISVPAEILSKPGKLSGMEFSIIKTHPQVGYDILKDIAFPWPLARLVFQHHEKMDGSGYPQGLSGEDILLEARILCVADVVEAMASHRPYRPSLGIDKALEEIQQNRCTFYDPEVVDVCLKLFKEKGFKFE
jgi:putative two-component system response regulator